MILPLASVLSLAQACAPSVAPASLLAVIRAESGFDPWVLAVNGARREVLHPGSRGAAATLLRRLASQGASVDVGLAQINSRTLARWRLAPDAALDPCRNLALAAQVLSAGYLAASPRRAPQVRLRLALSRYNTGDPRRGFRNGYVARVEQAAARMAPRLRPAVAASPIAVSDRPPPPAWDVFAGPELAAVGVF